MKTYSFTTDASEPDEAIVTQSACRKVIIYENAQTGTADYKIRLPGPTDSQITKPAGSKIELEVSHRPFWFAGETIGYISSASGSLTMAQEEY